MFDPSRDDVRRFFCETWRKHGAGLPLTPLESMALDLALDHPEYHEVLSDLEASLVADFSVERARSNPFLHLSMHLAIQEQCSIDQPPGIRAATEALARRLDSRHEAEHAVMECLGEVVWLAQRNHSVPDGLAYVDCVQRRLGHSVKGSGT